MELEVPYKVENEQQFWDELDEVLSKDSHSHDLIDNALRSYLNLATTFRGEYINSQYDITRCCYKLLSSSLFETNADYIRQQIVHSLLEDDDPDVLRFAASLLICDARESELTFDLMNNEGAFPRLVDLILNTKQDAEPGLHRQFMELLYEMSRIQRIDFDDLVHVEDDFVRCLFQIIEEASDDVADPYHYAVIRVLLVLNEQFMVAAHAPNEQGSTRVPLTNRVIKILSSQGASFKTFGENIILLLNRESETSLQLLTLKLLYLLFTTPLTYEYFYTNDLRVLVDILIRNLLDLPEDASALRHTYLRVLYPLLAHTQLRHPPQYKREELRKLLALLVRGQVPEGQGSPTSIHWQYFEDVDETTVRLVNRCQKVAWLSDLEAESIPQVESPVAQEQAISPTSPLGEGQLPPAVPAPRKLTKRNSSKASGLSIAPYLTPTLESARASTLSMLEVAAHREKPGIITPSRRDGLLGSSEKRERPAVPRARRSGWGRRRPEKGAATSFEGEQAKVDANRRVGPEGELEVLGTASDTLSPGSIPELEVAPIPLIKAPSAPSPSKKPPPAPKSRRWRGNRAKTDNDLSGAIRNVHFRSISQTATPLPSISIDPPFPPPPPKPEIEKTLTGAEVGSPKESVSSALGEAHEEAISGTCETLEKVTLNPTAAEQQQQQQQQLTPKVVLAPPSPAPPRSVPAPRFELERSPFLHDEDDEDDEDE